MAIGLHKIADGTIWYFPTEEGCGYLVEKATPLTTPRWNIQCAYIGKVNVVVEDDEMAIDLLKLPKLWN